MIRTWGCRNHSKNEAGGSSEQCWDHKGSEPTNVEAVLGTCNPVSELSPKGSRILLLEIAGLHGSSIQLGKRVEEGFRSGSSLGGEGQGRRFGHHATRHETAVGGNEGIARRRHEVNNDEGGRELHDVKRDW